MGVRVVKCQVFLGLDRKLNAAMADSGLNKIPVATAPSFKKSRRNNRIPVHRYLSDDEFNIFSSKVLKC